jgi:hypothetical protein
MKLTSQEYAEMIIKEYYKVPNIYNLARAIARVGNKYAKWVMESAERSMYAVIEGYNDTHVAELQHEAKVKTEAYRLALVALTDKLPK